MKRALPSILLCMLATAAACADSTEEPSSPVDADASVQTPPSDAGAPTEASADATPATDAEPGPPSTCNEDGWCRLALPDPQPFGLSNFRIIGLVMDGPGKVWAATNSFPLGDGYPTSHLLHYENGAWSTAYGIGPDQPGPFPYSLLAIAGNGAGSLMAVGKTSSYEIWPPQPIVLRLENGKVIEEHPEGLRAFVAVGFTSTTDAYALDDEGRLYATTIGSDGPLVWTEQATPHAPASGGWPPGPKTFFVSTDGKLILGGEDWAEWPPRKYIDRQLGDGSWMTSFLPDTYFDIQAGTSTSSDALWLVGPYFIGAKQLPSEVPDAEDPPEPVWSTMPNPYSSHTFRSIWARNENDIWAAGDVGRVFHFDGTTWSDAKLALNGAPMSVDPLNAVTGWPATGELWIGGESLALHYTPKGTP